jgi:hypothetical protein
MTRHFGIEARDGSVRIITKTSLRITRLISSDEAIELARELGAAALAAHTQLVEKARQDT